MATLSGFPYLELEISKLGAVFKPEQREAILVAAAGANVSDLVVISHGWNNDIAEARKLYADLFANVARLMGTVKSKGIVVVGVLWPSKRFADAELIPGGGAAS